MNLLEKKPHVLHVDDEDDFLELFSYAFQNNFEIESVNNGKDAIELVRRNSIDAVVTDYDMPGINGIELLRRIKEVNPDMPVVLQTGQGNEEVAREAFILGASDYFTKDFFSFAHKEKFVNSIYKAVEIKKARFEKELSEKKYSIYIENAPESVFVYDEFEKIIEINRAVISLTGYSKEELLEMSLDDLRYSEDDIEAGKRRTNALKEKGRVSGETIILRKDGSRAYISIEAVRISPDIFISFCKDITDLKRVERQKALSIHVLEMLNQPLDSLEVVEKILDLIKDEMGFQAVGIRLRKEEDFPYFYTNGFCSDFVDHEEFLVARNNEGEIIRDARGNPLLECMCGNIICGRTDPEYPFFTKGGSFWSNSTSILLASTGEEDRQSRTRNRCHDSGFESVALIPIKSGDVTIGLLQFNDSRTDCFTLEMIEFFEGLGSSIGIALDRIRTAKQIRDLSKFPSENPSPVIRISNEGVILYGNEASSELFDYWNRHQGEKLPDHMMDIINKIIKTGVPGSHELICRDRIYSFLFTPIKEHGYINMYGNDITVRKKTRLALQESEIRFREMADLLPQTIFETDIGGKITYSNRFGIEFLGFPDRESLYGEYFTELISPKDHEKLNDNILKILDGSDIEGHEYTLVRRDGRQFPIIIYSRPIVREGKTLGVRGVIVDMSRQKQLEGRLRKERDRAQQYLDMAGVMILALNRDGNITLINRKGIEILGCEEKNIVGKNWFDTFLPDRMKVEVKKGFGELIAGEAKSFGNYENPILTSGGEERIIAWHNSILTDDAGRIAGIISSGEDITDRKKAENALRESESRLRSIFRAAPVGIGLVDEYRQIIKVNKEMCDILGYTNDEMLHKTTRFLYPTNKEYEEVVQEKTQLMQRKGAGTLETRWKKKDGKIIDILFSASPVDTSDLLKGITFTAIDITNRKAAEEKIRRSEAKFRSLSENIPDLIVRFDEECRYIFGNQPLFLLPGYDKDTFIGKTHRDLGFPPEQCDYQENAVRQVFKTGKLFESLLELDGPEGKLLFDSRLIPERDDTGKIISVMGIARDITHQVEVERNYHLLFNEMMAGIALHKIICDENGKPIDYIFLDMNSSFENLTGLQKDKIIGRTVKEIMPNTESYWIEKYGEVALTGKSVQFENYSVELDKHFEVTAFMTKPGHFACIFHDISERKKAEAEIQQSLVEKEILLREIHHRVKNNLQIIISLLDMQSHTTDNQEIIDLLGTCIHRVNSMALIHQKLYRSTQLVEIDMNLYVRELADNLVYSYREEGFIPSVNVEIESINLKIDYAIPCGLILNELVTNCLKHAFKGRNKGKIDISIKSPETGKIELIVQDNGIGLPKGIIIEKIKTLGLGLVDLLVDQLRGTLEIKRKRGTIFIIKFNLR